MSLRKIFGRNGGVCRQVAVIESVGIDVDGFRKWNIVKKARMLDTSKEYKKTGFSLESRVAKSVDKSRRIEMKERVQEQK